MTEELGVELYTSAILLARKNNQVVGSKNDYYVTLDQLEALLQKALTVKQ